MKLPAASWQDRPGMGPLLEALGASDGDTRYVGGAVRDGLLGLDVSDVDLATRLAPETVLERLGAAGIKAVPTGIAHGTVTAVIDGAPVEVTTLRRDVATDGRRATIAYTDDWREDAARRDFSINALSADPISLEIFDYFSGEADLAARHIRFIGDPLIRIAEDHLRILRFFRFHARFGRNAPDPEALASCAARANDLMALSRERISDEILKLLALPDPAPTLALMIRHAILRPVLPEIEEIGVERLERLIAAERAAQIAPHPVRRLAALLTADPDRSASVAARLRLSNKAGKRLISAAGRGGCDRPDVLAYEIGLDEAIDRLLIEGRDPAPLARWRRPHFAIGGGDLIGMGLPPGPIVARTLQAIERQWAQDGFPDDDAALRSSARRAVDQALLASQ